MKKRTVLILSLVFVLGIVLSCGGKGKSSSASGSAATAKSKAACILGVGGLGDQSFNDLVYEGMNKAKTTLGVDFDYAEPKMISDFELIIRDMAGSGKYGVIICVGFDQVDPLTKIAPEFPSQKFALIDGVVDAPNVVNYLSKEHEGSFLVGALAGLMKQNPGAYKLKTSNKLGFIGALEIPLIQKFLVGYAAGAGYVNPKIEVFSDYVGGSNPFSDTTTAKEIAASQNSKGADIVYHAAGGSGLGVFQAAKDGSFYAIGCNSNQNIIDPDHIVASMLKRVDTAAFEVVKAAMVDNSLVTGTVVLLGLSDEGVGYILDKSNIKVNPEDIKKVDAIKEKIVSGELVVPEFPNEIAAFLAKNKY